MIRDISIPYLSNTGPRTSLVRHERGVNSLPQQTFSTPRCSRSPSSHLRVFFFIAGTISVFMSTFRSNLRVKHSLLGSCREGLLHVKAFLLPVQPHCTSPLTPSSSSSAYVCVSTHISMSSPGLLLHQLYPSCFPLPANQLHNT